MRGKIRFHEGAFHISVRDWEICEAKKGSDSNGCLTWVIDVCLRLEQRYPEELILLKKSGPNLHFALGCLPQTGKTIRSTPERVAEAIVGWLQG